MGLGVVGAQAVRFAASPVFAVLAGPIGWVLSALWGAFDLAGPAYRVTIPFTIYVAYYRYLTSKSKEEVEIALS